MSPAAGRAALDIDAQLHPHVHAPRWWVAFSGGLDSTALLHLLLDFSHRHRAPPITVLHVHHGLQAAADDWAAHCEAVCRARSVPLQVHRVRVDGGTGQGVEMAAREARYAIFASRLGEGDVLFMAHHQGDQAETLLLRLLRGAGATGLAGMPAQRPLGAGCLVRPLLGIARAQLESRVRDCGWTWIEDPSNANHRLDRNFLRHEVMPLLESRWPGSAPVIARAAALLRGQVLVEQQALAALLGSRSGQDRYGAWLAIDGLAAWPEGLRQALLRHWLGSLQQVMPSAARLAALDRDVLLAREDASGLWSLADIAVSRYRQRLYAHAVLPEAHGRLPWATAGQPLHLCDGSILVAESGQGPGSLCAAFPLQVRYREGGERCRPAGRAHSQTLNRLFQEHAVPPWLRGHVPLLYGDGQLLAVGDFWVCAGHEAAAGQDGWKIRWEWPSRH